MKKKIDDKNAKRLKGFKDDTYINSPNNILLKNSRNISLSETKVNKFNFFITEPTMKTKGLTFEKYTNRKGHIIQTNSPPIISYIQPKIGITNKSWSMYIKNYIKGIKEKMIGIKSE